MLITDGRDQLKNRLCTAPNTDQKRKRLRNPFERKTYLVLFIKGHAVVNEHKKKQTRCKTREGRHTEVH